MKNQLAEIKSEKKSSIEKINNELKDLNAEAKVAKDSSEKIKIEKKQEELKNELAEIKSEMESSIEKINNELKDLNAEAKANKMPSLTYFDINKYLKERVKDSVTSALKLVNLSGY